jgi:L-ascorbate metabolism protein UlaG (beta-lactamase superfamily)
MPAILFGFLVIAAVLVDLSSDATAVRTQQAPLQARFIGQMAFSITDGSTTVISDFPYQVGYAGAPPFSPKELQAGTPATLALVTHRHADHWEPALFAKTTWKVAGPKDVTSGVPADRVVVLAGPTKFESVLIEPVETPHAQVGHYSYIVTWQGKRLYFSGDTEETRSVVSAKNLDAAFVSPWLYGYLLKQSARIDAKRVVIYHHEAGQQVPGCAGGCVVPKQGETISIQ